MRVRGAGETLFAVAARLAEELPDRRALVIGDRRHHETLTLARLDDRGRRVAAALAARGFERGDRLAVWLPNLPEWLVLQLAAARLGVSVLAINTRFRSEELLHLITLGRPRGLAFAPGFLDIDFTGMIERVLEENGAGRSLELLVPVRAEVAPIGGLAVASFEELLEDGESGEAPASGRPDDLAILFPTSGTTSLPKLAAHDQASVVEHSRNAAAGLRFEAGDVMLSPLPLCGVFGFNAIFAAVLAGGSCLSQAVFDGPESAELGERHRATHFVGTDPMLTPLIAAGRPRTLSAGIVSIIGDHPQRLLAAAEKRLGVRLTDVYGSSECFALLAFWPREAPVESRVLKGGALVSPGIEVRIVDTTTGRPLPALEQGEIQFRGYNVLRCYLHNPDATARAIGEDGWYRTGDLGYVDHDGNFVFLSRLDDSLRLHGFLVNPGEIETHLERHPAVAAAQVVGVKDDRGNDVPVAFVIRAPAADCTSEDLRRFCVERIAAFKAPQAIWFVDDFPRTVGTNGAKVQRTVLRERARSLYSAAAPERGG